MRALLLIGACLACVALVLGFTAFNGNDAKAAKPTLRIVMSAPTEVRGEHFRPREVVRVTAGKRALRTTANGNGYFIVTIPGSGRCDSTRVLARGSAGSYAVVKQLPSPECLPARTN
jgi:L-asparaginase II